jgi:hypothetical protein
MVIMVILLSLSARRNDANKGRNFWQENSYYLETNRLP